MGWAIGKGEEYTDQVYQDQVEAEALYDLLERDVVPTFYERGNDRIPRQWVDRMKACVDSLCHFVNTHRMVRDYVEGYYMKAHARFRTLEGDHAALARQLSAALDRIRGAWKEVWVAKVDNGPNRAVPVASSMQVMAVVHLGSLTPQDVVVELYAGRVDQNGELVDGHAIAMQATGPMHDGTVSYAVETAMASSGLHGITVRVRPNHPDLPVAFVPDLICWAAASPSLVQA